MADATDLKSVDRKVVRVRLPPSAPIQNQRVTGNQRTSANCPFLCFVCLWCASLSKQRVFVRFALSMTRLYSSEDKRPRREHPEVFRDRKSTRLNSSHGYISYAV